MRKQPQSLTIVKVIRQSLLVRIVFAVDEDGSVWKRVEGFGESEWELYKER